MQKIPNINIYFQFKYSCRKSVSHTSVYVFFCCIVNIVHLDENVCLEKNQSRDVVNKLFN